MKHHPLRRIAVALAAFGLAFVALAGPASATIVSGEVTSGTLRITNAGGTGLQTIPLGASAGTSECEGQFPPSTIDADLTPSTIDLDDVDITGQFTFAGDPFIAVIEEDLTTSYQGSVSGSTPASINDFGVGLSVDIYEAIGDPPCEIGDPVCLDLTVTLNLDGTFSGNPASPVSPNFFTLTGSDVIALDSFNICNAPFTSYLGGHVQITGADPLVVTL